MKENSYILITGDFFGNNLSKKELNQKDILFNDFAPIINNSKLAITNLESVILDPRASYSHKRIAKTGPHIYSEPQTLRALKEIGFKMVTLANNHIMDYGTEGLANTLTELKKNSIEYIGAGLSREERSRPYVYSDKRISILNFCENEWSAAYGNEAGANPLNIISNYQDITAQKVISDLVIVILHGGNEFYNLPSPKFRDTCRLFIHFGADYVVCHHTHTYSGYEKYGDGYIFYGLGNFYFTKKRINPQDSWYYGYAIKIYTELNTKSFELIPYYQNAFEGGIRLLSPKESIIFFEKIAELNEIIIDDVKLDQKFEEYAQKISKQYLAYLQPYNNKYFTALFKWGFLPSLLSKGKGNLLLNLIRCESHHALLLRVLKNISKK